MVLLRKARPGGRLFDMAEERPKTINSIYPFMPGGSTEGKYVQRRIASLDELEDIKNRGYVLPKEGGKGKKYWTAVDSPRTNYPEGQRMIRVERSAVSPDFAVRAADVELHDPKTGTWGRLGGGSGGASAGSLLREMNPQKLYKKGGAVKSASSRADGIAQRGKTRGKIV